MTAVVVVTAAVVVIASAVVIIVVVVTVSVAVLVIATTVVVVIASFIPRLLIDTTNTIIAMHSAARQTPMNALKKLRQRDLSSTLLSSCVISMRIRIDCIFFISFFFGLFFFSILFFLIKNAQYTTFQIAFLPEKKKSNSLTK